MKLTLMAFLMLSVCSVKATNYYFSASSGDDSRTSIQAQSSSTPWKTLTKLNAVFSSLQPGDSVLFKRGETFYGFINASISGTTASPIVFAAYGSGNRPIITGFTTVSSWTSLGNGIYESSGAVSSLTSLNALTINEVMTPMGRYPNRSASNGGYLTYNSHSGTTSITGPGLPFTPTSATVVIRENAWRIDKRPITGYSGGTITYSGGATYYAPTDGFGYFVQNHLNTLDQLGEWYFNPSTKKVSVYFGSNNPSSYTVNLANISNLVNANGFSNISFKDITFKGADENCFNLSSGTSSYLNVENCDMLFSGNGISCYPQKPHHLTISNCSIKNMYDNGLALSDYAIATTITSNTITNNTITNIGSFQGAGSNGDAGNTAIVLSGSNHMISGNKIDSAGYHGIYILPGNNTVIQNNSINYFSFVKDDGAGIYTYAGSSTATYSGQKINYNIVLNGIGAPKGSIDTLVAEARGIYFDENSRGFEVVGNTIAQCVSWGLFCHGCRENTFTDNTIYDNGKAKNNIGGALWWQRVSTQPVRNLTVKRNVFFSKLSTSETSKFWSTSGSDDIAQFGVFDSNYYCRPVNEPNAITSGSGGTINVYNPSTYKWVSLDSWKTLYGKDAHSAKTPLQFTDTSKIRFEYNETASNKTVSLGSTGYVDVKNKSYSGNLVLAPYSSIILLNTGTTSTVPTVSITNPLSNASFNAPAGITINANAADADGTIGKVEFYNGSTLLGTDISSPYTFAWSNVPAGNYSLTAKATDNSGLVTTSAIVPISVVTTNTAPTVSITSPTASTSFTDPVSITINANAADADGTIGKVEFYNGSTLLGTDISSPYTFAWSNVPAGNYSLTAKATDNSGLVTTSAIVPISVITTNTAPTVSITSPTSSSSFTDPASITINATAADANGSISKVEFYSGTTLMGAVSTSPYAYVWNKPASGNYTLTAKATDNGGLVTTSPAVTVSVTNTNIAPSVAITAPASNTSYVAPASINITATATDTDGSIAKVDFYNGTILLGSSITPPYAFNWTNVAAGNYTIMARAYDDKGVTTNSSPVSISVTNTNFAFLSFSGLYANTSNNLSWQTNNAANTYIFKIQRGKMTNNLKEIARISPIAGSSSETLNYTFIDPTPLSGKNYYRIVRENTNGQNVLTNTILVDRSSVAIVNRIQSISIDLADAGVKLSPNPANNVLSVSLQGFEQNKVLKISILSFNGMLISSINSNSSNSLLQVNVSNLAAGTYVLEVSSGYQIVRKSFVKN